MRSYRFGLGVVVLSATLVVFSYGTADGDWMQAVSVSESDNGFGLPIDASATVFFNSGSQELTITLENLLVNPKAVNQNLSGLFLSFTTAESTAVQIGSSGIERFVANDGSYVDGSSMPVGWNLIDNAVDPLFGTLGIHLDLLSAGTAPSHTIIGLPDSGSLYSNANNSITGNGPHNPFLASSATFVLDIPGLTDASRIQTATFQFNTSGGTYFGIPEPSAFLVLGFCVGVLGFRRSRNCRRNV